MSYPDVPGFTPRTAAIQKYGRSKSSFIRNIKDAFAEGDTNILNSFRVYFSDGSFVTYIDGPKATDEKIAKKTAKLGNNGYRVFIETALLESGELEKSEKSTTKKPEKSAQKQEQGTGETTPLKLTDATDRQQLEHELALLRERNLAHAEKIESLTADKEFLKQELESRRDDMEDLKGLFQSIGTAADSTAKLQSGKPSEDNAYVSAEEGTHPDKSSEPINATSTTAKAETDPENNSDIIDVKANAATPESEDFWIRNTPTLPTLGKAMSSISKSFSRS